MSGHDEHHHQHHEHDHEHQHDEHQHHQEGENSQQEHVVTTTSPSSHVVESGDFVQPSAPTLENGYIVVPPTPQSSIDSSVQNVVDILTHNKQEEINRLISDLAKTGDIHRTVVAEADSSHSTPQHHQESAAGQSTGSKPSGGGKQESTKKSTGNDTAGCSLCPYYLLACDRLSKVEIPPKVKDLLLWKDMKLTGAVFGSAFVLLISLAAFSFLTVISTLFLTALSCIGAYRFYLGLIFRIKGTYDNTFDKLSAHDISLPKDKVKQLAHLLENDFNQVLLVAKSILLWDNLTTSIIAFVAFYIVYCVGCMFNTITLFILILVSAFTLPKIYDVYKKPIDQAIEKGTAACHQVVKQVMAKIPMLNKSKKTQ